MEAQLKCGDAPNSPSPKTGSGRGNAMRTSHKVRHNHAHASPEKISVVVDGNEDKSIHSFAEVSLEADCVSRLLRALPAGCLLWTRISTLLARDYAS
mmetsp:Transcript_5123/g.18117  ORF Transcript_5123/g.18117 Transcript_5123/m.18117 type:complete len:97 (-) Transcript_5123:1272-1562(-)